MFKDFFFQEKHLINAEVLAFLSNNARVLTLHLNIADFTYYRLDTIKCVYHLTYSCLGIVFYQFFPIDFTSICY